MLIMLIINVSLSPGYYQAYGNSQNHHFVILEPQQRAKIEHIVLIMQFE